MVADNIINFQKSVEKYNLDKNPRGVGEKFRRASAIVTSKYYGTVKKAKPYTQSISKNIFIKKRMQNVGDRIKVMRFQNKLEKAKLKNAIENYKLRNRVELLRRKGLLPQPQTRIIRPIIIQPYHNDPLINQDIASAFNADMQHGDKSLFGNENYYGGEKYYDEDIYGNEFNGDMLAELGINIRPGVSPLLY